MAPIWLLLILLTGRERPDPTWSGPYYLSAHDPHREHHRSEDAAVAARRGGAERGRVIIGRAGRPVAVLTAYDADPGPRTLGGWKDRVWIAEDFDDPLPEPLQRHFDGTES